VTVRPAVVLARLAHFGQALAQLDRLKQMPAETRGSDPLLLLAAERALHIATEAAFDIGHHVLAGRGLAVPSAYRDVIPALSRSGIVPATLQVRLIGLAGLRNLLVHDYADVDPIRVWELVDTRLDDLRDLHACLSALPELGTTT
jgi:uncharacterized protein YutE (UPF0331/DUF86 family)